MYINKALIIGCALFLGLPVVNLQAAEVNITPEIESVSVKHGSADVSIMRNQNQKNCNNCGTNHNEEDAKYCKECGAKL